MTTTWKTQLDPRDAWDLAMSFPQAFTLSSIQDGELEILDMEEAFRLSDVVEVMDDEDGLRLELDGVSYPLVEA